MKINFRCWWCNQEREIDYFPDSMEKCDICKKNSPVNRPKIG